MNKTQKTFANDNLFAEINSRSLREDLADALISLTQAVYASANDCSKGRLAVALNLAEAALIDGRKAGLKAAYMNLLVEFMAADEAALRAIARKSELAAEAEAYGPTAEEVAAAAKVDRAAAANYAIKRAEAAVTKCEAAVADAKNATQRRVYEGSLENWRKELKRAKAALAAAAPAAAADQEAADQEAALATYRAVSIDCARRQEDGGHYRALEAVNRHHGEAACELVAYRIQKDWIG